MQQPRIPDLHAIHHLIVDIMYLKLKVAPAQGLLFLVSNPLNLCAYVDDD